MIDVVDCADDQILTTVRELSRGREGPLSPPILLFYEDKVEEVERTDQVLRCIAVARLSDGSEFHVSYHYEIVSDSVPIDSGYSIEIGYSIGDSVHPPGSLLSDPFPVGAVMKGADGAEIRILQITPDAWSLVLAENQSNASPEEGNRFFIVRVDVINPPDSLQPVDVSHSEFGLIGDSRVIYSGSDNCGLTPDQLDLEILPGSSAEGNVCFEIPENEEGLILIYSPGYAEEDRRFIWLPEEEDKITIAFSDLNWTTVRVQNRIAQYIVEKGYGYETDAISGTISPNFESLLKGDIHIAMEIWLPIQQADWDDAVAHRQVVSVGESLGQVWESSFLMPKYLADEYPGLRTVGDLTIPEYNQLFQTMDSRGKARLVGCATGWICEHVVYQEVESYGLTNFVEVVAPGDEDALYGDLRGNYSRQEPWLGYLWGTADPALVLDMVRLEEPPYTEECWATTKACAIEGLTVLIGVHPSLEEKAPDVVEFLNIWDLNVGRYRPIAKYMADNPDAGIQGAAIWYLKNNEPVWSQWVPADVAEKVNEALAGS